MLELVGDPRKQRDAFADACAWAEQIHVCLGWLEGGDAQGPSWDVLEPHLAKVQVAVIGFGFMRSEPALLEALYERGVLRVVASTDGGYAPNAFVFRRGTRVRTLIGSAPFSSAAHEESVEAMVLYEGEAEDAFALQALQLVERCKSAAHLPTRDALTEYKDARLRELARMRGMVQAPLSMRAKRFHAPDLGELRAVTDRASIKRGMIAVVDAFEHACTWEGPTTVRVRRDAVDVWIHWLRPLSLWSAFRREEDHYASFFGIDPDGDDRLASDLELRIAFEDLEPLATAFFAQRGADPALYLVFRGVKQGRSIALSPEAAARLGGAASVTFGDEGVTGVPVGNVLSPDFPATLAAFARELKSCLEVLT